MHRRSLVPIALLPLVLPSLAAGVEPALGPVPDGLTTEEVVGRVADALGGRERLEAVDGYVMRTTIEGMGMQGTATTHAAFPDRQRDAMILGPLTLLMVARDGTGWFRDHNGHVTELSAAELRTLRTDLYVDAFRPWLDPVDEEVVRLVGTMDVDGVACPALRVQPGGGAPLWIAVSPDGWLPVRQVGEDESGMGLDVVDLADYRAVGGVLWPHTMRSYNDQLPANRSVYVVESIAPGAPPGGELYRRPEEREDVTFPPGSARVTLPLSYHQRHLFVEAHLVGDGVGLDGTFLLDTGSTLSMLDADVARRLGLQRRGDFEGLGIGGTMDVQLVRLPFLRVGGVLLEDQLLGVVDLADDMERQLGVRVAGLLGYDFFSRLVVTLDYAGRSCTLSHPNAWDPPPGGTTLGLELIEQQPAVAATLDGDLGGLWRVDTGADGVTLHGPAAARWDVVQRHPDGRRVWVRGLGGEVPGTWIRARSLALGPYEVRQPMVLLVEDDDGVLGARAIVGNLGNAVLDRFVVTVDIRGGRIHLLPGPDFDHRDRIRMVDFQVGWLGARVAVIAVEEGGAGWSRGLRRGQEVLRLGGRPAAAWTEAELERLWAGETRRRVTLLVRDESGRRRVSVAIPPPP